MRVEDTASVRTEPNRLMLCGETVAVCCENRTEHTDTLWIVRTSQETHHISATEPNWLTLCGDTYMRRWQDAEFVNVKAGGTYSYHYAYYVNN
jgi:hypothetical protein